MATDADSPSAPLTLRPYQRAAIDAIYRYWREKKGCHPPSPPFNCAKTR